MGKGQWAMGNRKKIKILVGCCCIGKLQHGKNSAQGMYRGHAFLPPPFSAYKNLQELFLIDGRYMWGDAKHTYKKTSTNN